MSQTSSVAVGVALTELRGAPTATVSALLLEAEPSFFFGFTCAGRLCLGAFWEDRMLALMRIKEAAKVLAVSESMVRKLVGSGQLTAVRIGRSVRVRSDEVQALMASSEQ